MKKNLNTMKTRRPLMVLRIKAGSSFTSWAVTYSARSEPGWLRRLRKTMRNLKRRRKDSRVLMRLSETAVTERFNNVLTISLFVI